MESGTFSTNVLPIHFEGYSTRGLLKVHNFIAEKKGFPARKAFSVAS